MIDTLIPAVTFLTALGAGLMAGFLFAFSACVMKALGRIPPAQGIAAMQSINVTVINPLFLTVFLGTAVGCVLLANFSMLRWHRPDSGLLLAGSASYLVGTILVTMVCNVPRNDRLAAVDAASAEGARLWSTYLTEWTAWNHARTIASIAAAAALTLALRR